MTLAASVPIAKQKCSCTLNFEFNKVAKYNL